MYRKTKTGHEFCSIVLAARSRGTFGDDTADELAASAKSFAALRTLDVSRSYLTTAGVRRLRAAFPGVEVLAKDQRAEYDAEYYGTARFVSVHE